MLRIIHVLDVHVDQECHKGGEHEEDLRLGVDAELLELEVVEGSQYFVHARVTASCTPGRSGQLG